MARAAIEVSGLGKRYRIGARSSYRTLRETISGAFAASARRASGEETTHWALRGVDFRVEPGERVGIIGRNGAGKSTLLKVLARITDPTEGEARVHGRVGSLLEVGTGFHPELTGRENVFLNGTLLGMRAVEVRRKFDEIVAFAEVERFLDTPVKHYSSGMYVRLAFAVAAHLEAEILLVDEVLAVGDFQFQKKCMGKMDAISREGRTVLLVSHNLGAVQELCSKALLLERGGIAAAGPLGEVLDRYMGTGAGATVDLDALAHDGPRRFARLRSLALRDAQQRPCVAFVMNEPFHASLTLEVHRHCAAAEVGLKISSRHGSAIHYLTSTWEGLRGDLEPGRYRYDLVLPRLLVFPGHYRVGLWVLREGEPSDDSVQDVTVFEVLKGNVSGYPTAVERYAFSGGEVYAPSVWRLTREGGDGA